MKAKISRLSKGIFDKNIPEVELSKEMIEDTISMDGVLSGSFFIRSVQEVRGLLYTSTGRIALKESSFIGKQAEIHYEIHSSGMAAGERIRGFIWIVSDGGELTLPCEIQVEAPFAETSMGKVQNLFHFTNLVRNSYEEAKRLFVSKEFAKIFLETDSHARTVYEGLVKSTCTDTAMEEFLVSVNKKARVMLTLNADRREYAEFEHSLGDSIELRKSGWGYLPIEIETDSSFVHLQKRRMTSTEFSGNVASLSYIIEEKEIHAGVNLGRIWIRTPYQELSVEIKAERKHLLKENEKHRKEQHQLKAGLLELCGLYFEFRMRRLGTEVWCRRSLRILERLGGLAASPLFLELFRVQLLITQKKKGEAGFMLEHLGDKVLQIKEKQPSLYAYYLYIRVLHTRDGRLLKETLLTLQRLYENGGDDWQVLWVMLYLDEEYVQNKSLMLVQLKEQYGKGARSPFLYYEACAAFNEQPALIRVLNGFELQALWWGTRKGFITEKTAIQIAELSQTEKHGTQMLYRILEKLYESYKNKIILESLLALLIKDSRIEKRYFTWYEQGVLAQCTLTGLYEAFLYTMPEDYEKPVPRLVAMYFAFDSGLSDDAKERLYENLLRYGQENPSVLENHMPSMEQFVTEQIEKGRVNKRLAFLYKKIMKRNFLTEKIAGIYPRILLSRYIDTAGKQGRIIVCHKECGKEISAPLEKGRACIPVYTEEAALLYEDLKGRRFLMLSGEPEPLFSDEALIRRCFEINQGEVLSGLHICEKEGMHKSRGQEEMEFYRRIADSPLVGQYYRNQLCQKMIEYYMENYNGEKLEENLRKLSTAGLRPEERIKMIELLITRALYGEAYKELKRYGYEAIAVNRLMKLCVYLLWSGEGEKDTFLLELCAYVFFKGKYDETILNYLLKYYYGTTKNMLKLWQAAKDFSVDTLDLEERLIVQMLFSGSYVARILEVFEDYYSKSVNQMVIRAYLAQQSKEYFVNHLVVGDKVFYFIERELYQNQKEVPDICRLALLRYYSEQKELSRVQIEMSKRLIQEFAKEHKYFAFYKKIEQYMEFPVYLRDKTFVEYQSDAENVEIHYRLDTGNLSEKVYAVRRMEKSYASVYVKEFILFYGERLQYYIEEEYGQEKKKLAESENLTESEMILMDGFDMAAGESRYHLLNDICACAEMRDEVTLRELMQSYAEKKKLAEECFCLL